MEGGNSQHFVREPQKLPQKPKIAGKLDLIGQEDFCDPYKIKSTKPNVRNVKSQKPKIRKPKYTEN